MKPVLFPILAVAAIAACDVTDPEGRQVFVTREQATVLHKGPSQPFEVKFKAGYGAPEYWCAAGRFAQNQRLSGSAPIYRLTPNPRPKGSSMDFSFVQPPGGGQPTGLARIGGDPNSLSVFSATDQCNIVQRRLDNSF